jgi:hypothetical protein
MNIEDLILAFPDADHDWNHLSCSFRKKISLKFILANSHFPWNWLLISRRDDITPDIIVSRQDINWNMLEIAKNANFTWAVMQKYNYLNFPSEGVCLNPNITVDIIQDNKYYPWDFRIFSKNEFENHIVLVKKRAQNRNNIKQILLKYRLHISITTIEDTTRTIFISHIHIPNDIIELLLLFI